jgi:tRNA (guanine37-N1)-methyltransferase
MHHHLVSIFPHVYESFVGTSLIAKSVDRGLLDFHYRNPRDYSDDGRVDDTIYGGGAGMLIQAEPVIQAIEAAMSMIDSVSYLIVFLGPHERVFDQSMALQWSSYEHIIRVSGRYEGIDHRALLWCQQQYPKQTIELSLGQFVLLGGEVASMVMIEAVSRLIPGVIQQSASRQHESYNPLSGMTNIEPGHYTRPPSVR